MTNDELKKITITQIKEISDSKILIEIINFYTNEENESRGISFIPETVSKVKDQEFLKSFVLRENVFYLSRGHAIKNIKDIKFLKELLNVENTEKEGSLYGYIIGQLKKLKTAKVAFLEKSLKKQKNKNWKSIFGFQFKELKKGKVEKKNLIQEIELLTNNEK